MQLEGYSKEVLVEHFQQIQQMIGLCFQGFDGKSFFCDRWDRKKTTSSSQQPTGVLGFGETWVLEGGKHFEKGGVNFSLVEGESLPEAATVKRASLAGRPFVAMGVSCVMHPENPYLPTSHANVRMFFSSSKEGKDVWWFGGGFDLTPYYVFEEDAKLWHQRAKSICTLRGEGVYPHYKKWCDDYFYLKHRQETRGVGGLFFDDLSTETAQSQGWEEVFDVGEGLSFVKEVADTYSQTYVELLGRRKHLKFSEREKEHQLFRRGRYVEFNLLQDRGTIFGIQSKGRTESILMSMPPEVRWGYQKIAEEGTEEAKLVNYLQPIDWV